MVQYGESYGQTVRELERLVAQQYKIGIKLNQVKSLGWC